MIYTYRIYEQKFADVILRKTFFDKSCESYVSNIDSRSLIDVFELNMLDLIL